MRTSKTGHLNKPLKHPRDATPVSFTAYFHLFRRYLAPQRWSMATMAILLLSGTGLQLAGPQILRGFVNGVTSHASESRLVQEGLLFVLTALLTQSCSVLATVWSNRVSWTACNALRIDLASHLLSLGLDFHSKRKPGELIERADGDVEYLKSFFSDMVVQLTGGPLLLIGILAALAAIDRWLCAAFFVFSLIVLVALNRLKRLAPKRSTNDVRGVYCW